MKLELEPEKLRKMLRFCLVAVLLLIIGLLIGFTISRSNRMDGFQKIENADLADEYVLDGNDLNPSQASQGGTKSSTSSKKTSSKSTKTNTKSSKASSSDKNNEAESTHSSGTSSTGMPSLNMNGNHQPYQLHGNTPGNQFNGSLAAMQGDYSYVIDSQEGNRLVAIHHTPLGNDKTILTDMPILSVQVAGESIYAQSQNDPTQVLELDIVTGQCKRTLSIGGYGFSVYQYRLVYTDAAEHAQLISFNLGNSSMIWLADDVRDFVLYNSTAYYVNQADHDCLYRISLSGTGCTKLTNRAVERFCLINDTIYYTSNGALYTIDDPDHPIIESGVGAFNFVSDGSSLLYANLNDGGKTYHYQLSTNSSWLFSTVTPDAITITSYGVYLRSGDTIYFS